MDIKELLASDAAALPKKRDKREDLERCLATAFDGYFGLLTSLTAPETCRDAVVSRRPMIERLCASLKETIRLYLRGTVHKAYAEFEAGIGPMQEDLKNLSAPRDPQARLPIMYRMRRAPLGQLECKDIFHVPFQERHKVGVQRYSIPDVPMLYLGGSLYVCWEELDRPPFHEIQVSAFEIREDKRATVLDFGLRPTHVLKRGGIPAEEEGRLVSYLACWPLIAACSIRTPYPEGLFQVEYIVPQMLLQWVAENSMFQGIRYFSTRTDMQFQMPRGLHNYVFPPQKVCPTGVCENLWDMFTVTDPMPWDLLEAVQVGTHYGYRTEGTYWDPLPGDHVSYNLSKFGDMEDHLHGVLLKKKAASGGSS